MTTLTLNDIVTLISAIGTIGIHSGDGEVIYHGLNGDFKATCTDSELLNCVVDGIRSFESETIIFLKK